MEYSGTVVGLYPHEISLLFGRGGFRPAPLPDEPTVDWEGLRQPLVEINNLQQSDNRAVLARMTGMDLSKSSTVEIKDARQQRALPLALSVLAIRATADGRKYKKTPAAMGVLEKLEAEMQQLAAGTDHITHVTQLDYDD